jgi:hypothetical protein
MPEELLKRLGFDDSVVPDRRQLVIECEFTAFDESQIPELNERMRDFIERNRDSDDPRDLVAVGSAIRKYVATMHADALPSLALLLQPGRAPVPLDVELEVSKMVVRKLTANPREKDDPAPELADRLMEMVCTYLDDRQLPREKYGAVTLNAVLALALLRSRHLPEVRQRLQSIEARWFTELLARRLRAVAQAMPGRQDSQERMSIEALANELAARGA